MACYVCGTCHICKLLSFILHTFALKNMEGSGFYNDTELDPANLIYIPIGEKIARVVVVSIIFLLGTSLNAFVVLYTVCHPKSLKQSSIIFLLASSVVNLMILLSFIPFQAVNTFTNIASTEDVICKINGFLTGLSGYATNYALAVVSVDRFLLLVKPLIHKQYFKPKLSVGILVAVLVGLLMHQSTNVAFNRYEYDPAAFFCAPTRFVGIGIALLTAVVIVTPFIAIIVTNVWTFISTHQFIKTDHERRLDALGTKEVQARELEDNLYSKRINKVFGIFSCLLMSQIAAQLPQLVVIILIATIGTQNFPHRYSYATSHFFYLGCIANPIIQSYFRQDLSSLFKAAYAKIACAKKQG